MLILSSQFQLLILTKYYRANRNIYNTKPQTNQTTNKPNQTNKKPNTQMKENHPYIDISIHSSWIFVHFLTYAPSYGLVNKNLLFLSVMAYLRIYHSLLEAYKFRGVGIC